MSVGSHLCSRASFRQILANLPLPSASGYASISDTPTGDSHPIRSCPCRAYTLGGTDGPSAACHFVLSGWPAVHQDVIYYREKNWLILAEAVTSSGPVDGGRHTELAELFKDSKAGLVYVTAFPDRGEIFRKFLAVVASETEVWCASDPTHLVHFNGIRFLGPHNAP